MGPNPTQKLFHSKGNYKQSERTTLRMGNIIANETIDRINLKIYTSSSL